MHEQNKIFDDYILNDRNFFLMNCCFMKNNALL